MGLSSGRTQSTGGGSTQQCLASESLQADGAVSDGCRKRTKCFGSPRTPACTHVFSPPALIPPSAEQAPGSFGPLLWASERPL